MQQNGYVNYPPQTYGQMQPQNNYMPPHMPQMYPQQQPQPQPQPQPNNNMTMMPPNNTNMMYGNGNNPHMMPQPQPQMNMNMNGFNNQPPMQMRQPQPQPQPQQMNNNYPQPNPNMGMNMNMNMGMMPNNQQPPLPQMNMMPNNQQPPLPPMNMMPNNQQPPLPPMNMMPNNAGQMMQNGGMMMPPNPNMQNYPNQNGMMKGPQQQVGYDYPPPNYQNQPPPPNYGGQQRPEYSDYKQYYLVQKDSGRNLRMTDNMRSSATRSDRGRNVDNQTEYSDHTPPRDYYDQAPGSSQSKTVRSNKKLVKQNSSKQLVRKQSSSKGIMSTLMRGSKKKDKKEKKQMKSPKQSGKRAASFSEMDLEFDTDEYSPPAPSRGKNTATRDVRSKLKEKPRHQEYRPREADMRAQESKGDVMKALVKQAWSVQWSEDYKKPYYFNKYTGESLWEPPEEIMS